MPIYDLHCHSRCSDGQLTPTELVQRAAEFGVDVLALTDHDTVAGLAEARRAAVNCGVTLVNGVEFSTQWKAYEIHIVGLDIDSESPALQAFEAGQQARRRARAEVIDHRLQRLGFAGVIEQAYRDAGTDFICRLHIAKAMVSLGYVADTDTAFRKYIGNGKSAYVKTDWPTIAQAVETIHAANGISVLAHPLRYKMTNRKLAQLCADFALAGGRGIEVVRSGESPDRREHVASLAQKHNLLGSAGSDFHGPGATWCELGKLPPMPDGCNPVWRLFR